MKNTLSIGSEASQQFDSLRGLAAVMVLAGHTNQVFISPINPVADPLCGLMAQAGVMLFFALSGFLIGKSIQKNMESKSDIFDIKKYLLDRSTRIFPALLLSMAILLLLGKIAPSFFPSGSNYFLKIDGYKFAREGLFIDLHDIWMACLFQNGFYSATPNANGPLWSLSIEVWYYFVAGFAFFFARYRFLSVIGLLGIVYLARDNDLFFYYAPVWFFGLLFSFAGELKRSNLDSALSVLSLVFFAMCVYLGWKFMVSVHGGSDSAYKNNVVFNLAFGFYSALALLRIEIGSVRFIKWFSCCAKFSYTLYLVHIPMLLFAFGVLQKTLIQSVFNSVVLSLLTALGILLFSKLLSDVSENKNRQLIALKALNRLFKYGLGK